jgi:hypothetical protein
MKFRPLHVPIVLKFTILKLHYTVYVFHDRVQLVALRIGMVSVACCACMLLVIESSNSLYTYDICLSIE